jgi:3-isopropylmalate/(R)-2-methylmalate dehydratase small subunit
MTPFSAIASVVAPIDRDNIDTDAIIPSSEIKFTGKNRLEDGLFARWRYTKAGSDFRVANPDFVLNQPQFAAARILAVGANFGCGSSREHAVWALMEYGIICVIAESFAPIFRSNCIRNGLLPITLDRASIGALAGNYATINLARQMVNEYSFEIDAEAKSMLLDGLDAIDLTLKHRQAIAQWQDNDRQRRPWIYLEHRR